MDIFLSVKEDGVAAVVVVVVVVVVVGIILSRVVIDPSTVDCRGTNRNGLCTELD